MANYRKIWEEANGPIPVDDSGRSFEIHHIDGDRENNAIDNLQCVSVFDHFFIHHEKGDVAACLLMIYRLEMEDDPLFKILKSEISRESNRRRLANGTHNFLKPEHHHKVKVTQKRLYSEGKHHFCNGQTERGQKSAQSRFKMWKSGTDDEFFSLLGGYKLYRTFRLKNGKMHQAPSSIVMQAINYRFDGEESKVVAAIQRIYGTDDYTYSIGK